jgi:hypothetical protein
MPDSKAKKLTAAVATGDLGDAALALAAMKCCLEDFDPKVVSNALVVAIVALRTDNQQYGLVRLEQARDAVALMSAKLADEVIRLDTAIKNIQDNNPEVTECSTTTAAEG